MNKFIKINKKIENTGESSLNEKYLKHDNLLDFDGLDLFSELNILKEIIGLKNDKSTISVPVISIPVASAEKNFLKFKLIKYYLRSTMSPQTLNIKLISFIVYWKIFFK